jgi:hypothetical protein
MLCAHIPTARLCSADDDEYEDGDAEFECRVDSMAAQLAWRQKSRDERRQRAADRSERERLQLEEERWAFGSVTMRQLGTHWHNTTDLESRISVVPVQLPEYAPALL